MSRSASSRSEFLMKMPIHSTSTKRRHALYNRCSSAYVGTFARWAAGDPMRARPAHRRRLSQNSSCSRRPASRRSIATATCSICRAARRSIRRRSLPIIKQWDSSTPREDVHDATFRREFREKKVAQGASSWPDFYFGTNIQTNEGLVAGADGRGPVHGAPTVGSRGWSARSSKLAMRCGIKSGRWRRSGGRSELKQAPKTRRPWRTALSRTYGKGVDVVRRHRPGPGAKLPAD